MSFSNEGTFRISGQVVRYRTLLWGGGREISYTVVEHVRINTTIKTSFALNGDEVYGTKSVDGIISYDILALPQLREDNPNVVSEHDRALQHIHNNVAAF